MDNDLLLFEVRSIADGVDKGFMAAAESAKELGNAYDELTSKEEKTAEQMQSVSTKAKQHASEVAKAKAEEAKAILQTTEARIRDLTIVREDFKEAQKYWSQQKKIGQDRTKASLELHNAEQELARIERELNEAREDGSKALDEYNRTLDRAVKSEEQLQKAKKQTTKAMDDGQSSSIALAVSIGALIGIYASLKRGLDSATASYTENRSAMVGLRSIAEGTGNSFGAVQKEVDKFIADGLVPLADASTAVKNLLARGFGLDEAIDIMNRFKDSAAFGRQSSLELGEAVRTATEGIKNENSVLVDNAGVTKNVSVMWKEYADELGVGVQSLTIAEKRQAEYNGIMRETQHQVGDAKKLSQEFAGSQAALTAQTTQLKVALGQAATGGIAPLNRGLAESIKGATALVKGLSPVISGVIQGGKVFIAGSVAALLFSGSLAKTRTELVASIPVLNMATGAFTALNAAMTSPIGIAAGAIAAIIGVIVGISSASEKAAADMEALNDEVKQLGADVGGAGRLVERFEELKNKASRTKEETAEMNKISEELVDSYRFRADGINEEGKGIATNLDLMKEQLEVQREMLRLKLQEAEGKNADIYKEAQQNLTQAKSDYELMLKQNESLRQSYEESRQGIYNITDAAREFGVVLTDINGKEVINADEWQRYLETIVPTLDQKEQEAVEKIEQYHDAISAQIANSVDLAVIEAKAKGQEVPYALVNAMNAAMEEIAQGEASGDVSSDMATNFITRYFDIEDAAGLAESKIEEINQLKQMIFAGLATSDTETSEAGKFASSLLKGVTDSSTIAKALEGGQDIRKKIEEGIATPQDRTMWNNMRNDTRREINQLINTVETEGKKLGIPTDGVISSLKELRDEFSMTAEEIEQAALEEKVKDMGLGDFISEVESAAGALKNLKSEIEDWEDLQSAIDVIRAGEEASEDYADALAWLADRYGVSEEAALNSLDAYQQDADLTNLLIQLKLALAEAEVQAAIGMVTAMSQMNSAVASNSGAIISNLQGVLAQLNATMTDIEALSGTQISMEGTPKIDLDIATGIPGFTTSIKVTPGGGRLFNRSGRTPSWAGYSSRGGGGSSGGGGGGGRSSGGSAAAERYSNPLLEQAMARLESQKHYNSLTIQEEIDTLNRIYRLYAKNAEERSEINKRLYDLKRQLADSNYAYLKSIDQLSIADEIRITRQKRDSYKRNTEAWREANVELYHLQKQQRRQIFDNDVYFGRLTLERQREWIRSQIRLYKAGTEQRIELEKELHDTIQQIRERDVQHIDTVIEAINTAVRERYNVQRQAEEDRLNKSIKHWQDWSDTQQKAIQDQIAALDDLAKTEDREEQDRRRRRDIAALEQRIQYENDLYNRQKLLDELKKKEEEYSKWKRANERNDLREALNAQAQAVAETAQAEQDRLYEQLEATHKYYDQLSRESAIQAQSEKILMKNSQTYIINLLKTYAPEYDTIGQTMGERLVEGFTKRVGNIDTWFNNFNKRVATYQSQMATAANAAASEYWRTRSVYDNDTYKTEHVQSAPWSQPTLHIYFNQPVESPAEVSRELERMAERLGRM